MGWSETKTFLLIRVDGASEIGERDKQTNNGNARELVERDE